MEQKKSHFQELNEALLIKSQISDIEDKKHYVLGMMSHETKFQSKCSRYCNDVQNFLDQMKMCIFMLKNLNTVSKAASEKGWDESHFVPFYQGVFTNQLYSIKEKILQLLNLLTDSKPKEGKHEQKIKIKKLRQRQEIINMDIDSLLAVWDIDDSKSTSGIKVALRKRVHHQHYIDPFQLNKELLNLKFAKTMLADQSRPYLSEFGVEKITKMEQENKSKLVEDTVIKMKNTLAEVHKSLDSLSEKIIKHFNYSYAPNTMTEILNKMEQFEKSIEIINESSYEKILPKFKFLLQEYIDNIKKHYQDDLESIYIYGSTSRGEYNFAYSDFNLCFVFKDTSPLIQEKLSEKAFFLNLVTLGKSEFIASTPEMRKLRFILHSDGVLIEGSDLIGKEEFPKAGLELAYLLNFDVMDNIKDFEKWLKENPEPSKEEMGKFAKLYAKRYIDFIFGVAMSNEPYYTSSRLKRLEWIKTAFENTGQMPDMMLAILHSKAIIEYENLVEIIEIFKEQAQKNITKMKKVIDNLSTK